MFDALICAVRQRLPVVLFSSAVIGWLSWQAGKNEWANDPVNALLIVAIIASTEIARVRAVAMFWQSLPKLRSIGFGLAALGLSFVSIWNEFEVVAKARHAAAVQSSAPDTRGERSDKRRAEIAEELKALNYPRSEAELAPLIANIVAMAIVCDSPTLSKSSREKCTELANMKGEGERAKKAAALRTTLAAIDTNRPEETVANQEAVNVSLYLNRLGLVTQPNDVDRWLALVRLACFQIGMLVVGVLAGAGEANQLSRSLPPPNPHEQGVTGQPTPNQPTPKTSIDFEIPPEARLVSLIAEAGGALTASQEELMKRLALGRQSVRTLVRKLKATNQLTIRTSATGTTYSLPGYEGNNDAA